MSQKYKYFKEKKELNVFISTKPNYTKSVASGISVLRKLDEKLPY
jgi:hypothetical protein